MKQKLIDYLTDNNTSNKLYALGFVFAIVGYSWWSDIESLVNIPEHKKGVIWGLCIALAFLCYTSAYLLTKWNKWRWFPLFVVLICISRVGAEFIFIIDKNPTPEKRELYDYISFLITIFIVFNYYVKHRVKQFKTKNDETNRTM